MDVVIFSQIILCHNPYFFLKLEKKQRQISLEFSFITKQYINYRNSGVVPFRHSEREMKANFIQQWTLTLSAEYAPYHTFLTQRVYGSYCSLPGKEEGTGDDARTKGEPRTSRLLLEDKQSEHTLCSEPADGFLGSWCLLLKYLPVFLSRDMQRQLASG